MQRLQGAIKEIVVKSATIGRGVPGPKGDKGDAGPSADSGIVTIASGPTLFVNLGLGNQIIRFTANQDFEIYPYNFPVSEAWAVLLEITNGGAYAVSFSTAFKTANGLSLSLVVAGTDFLRLMGQGNDQTKIVISVIEPDIK